jgi:hypothetical protein
MTIAISFIVALLGLVLYIAPKTPAKASEVGRIMFFVGLLWLVHSVSNRVVHL